MRTTAIEWCPSFWCLAAISAVVALVAGVVERHVRIPVLMKRGFAIALVIALALGCAAAWHREGSPEALAKRGWSAFQGRTTRATNGDVGARLTSLSADGRIPLWDVSIREFEHAPILGQGAGTFWEAWARYRSVPSDSTQAHSLYLGALGELGIIGLVVILAFVTAPFIAGVRGRARRLSPLTLGAYAAWARPRRDRLGLGTRGSDDPRAALRCRPAEARR